MSSPHRSSRSLPPGPSTLYIPALTSPTALTLVEKAKAKGNEFHKVHQTASAIAEYSKALSYFQTTSTARSSTSSQNSASSWSFNFFSSSSTSDSPKGDRPSTPTLERRPSFRLKSKSSSTDLSNSTASATPPPNEEELLQLLTSLLSNRSVGYLLLQKPNEASLDACEVIRLNPNWVKGYFRRAEALSMLKQYEDALEDFMSALERDKGNKIILEKIARTKVHIRDAEMGIVIHQLLPGRDICEKSILSPIQNLVFDFALQMQNIIHIIGNVASKEAIVVDPVWDVDGILRFAKAEGLTIVGAIITHHHIDHQGGIPPPPYDKWGVRVDGILKLLKQLRGIKAYIHPADIEEVIKANPDMPRERIHPTHDGEILMLPFGGLGSNAGLVTKEPSAVPQPNIGDIATSKTDTRDTKWKHHCPPFHSKSVTTLQIIHTPGHTAGSQCILVNNERILTGDTLFIGSCGRVDFPDSSPICLCNSLEKLSGFSDDVVVYPGHSYGGMWTTIGYERKMGLLNPKARAEFLEGVMSAKSSSENLD
ncbi:hypothetical protein HDV05_003407 [Chytridiales sp. JEL 0842]|nr:hypothetical protein HDV05_003407 [Chytridiales sp. JEL 0842]